MRNRNGERGETGPPAAPYPFTVPNHSRPPSPTPSDPLPRRVVWRVLSPHLTEKAQMEAYLRAGGYLVQTDTPLGPHASVEVLLEQYRVTPREHEVLKELAARDHVLEIAHALFVSQRTVEKHLARLRRKLGVKSLHRLIVEAFRLGLLTIWQRE